MKKKTICILPASLLILLCGCEQRHDYINDAKTIWLDTISIHGQSHEILLRSTRPTGSTNAGGMMHSPECWCKERG